MGVMYCLDQNLSSLYTIPVSKKKIINPDTDASQSLMGHGNPSSSNLKAKITKEIGEAKMSLLFKIE
jgi:hypothetical protein